MSSSERLRPSPSSTLRTQTARMISRILLEASGDFSRSSALLALLDSQLPGIQEAWILTADEEPEALRSLPQRIGSPLELPPGLVSCSLEVPGHAVSLRLYRTLPLSPEEQAIAAEIAAAIGVVLELKGALLQRSRALHEDFNLLVEATREISRCETLEDLYEVTAREGQQLLRQKQHNLLCLQRYSPTTEELICVAYSGESAGRLLGLKLSTSPTALRQAYYPRYEDGSVAADLPRQLTLSLTGALLKAQAGYVLIPDVDRLEDDEPYYSLTSRTRSNVAVPVVLSDGRYWGVLNVENPLSNAFSEVFDLPLLRAFARIIAVFIQELERRDKASTLDDIISLPPEHKRAIHLFAQSAESVLITGETGTGKELVARALHYGGPRRNRRFIPINCGAIEPNLMMSELFGHAAHSYTGAGGKDRPGLFQAASRGTIFLDEIENMPMPVQEALLRVVERGEVRKVGDTAVEEVEVRVVAATNVDLQQKIREGEFRQDLYYRLKILEITLPPLRERREFIPALFETFVGQLRRPMQEVRIDPAVLEALQKYSWPGNIRELKNLVKRMLVFSSNLTLELLPPEILQPSPSIPPASTSPTPDLSSNTLTFQLQLTPSETNALERLERHLLQTALNHFQGDRYAVATFLGISPPTVYRKIKQYGLKEERHFT